jgi:hypothetical protein
VDARVVASVLVGARSRGAGQQDDTQRDADAEPASMISSSRHELSPSFPDSWPVDHRGFKEIRAKIYAPSMKGRADIGKHTPRTHAMKDSLRHFAAVAVGLASATAISAGCSSSTAGATSGSPPADGGDAAPDDAATTTDTSPGPTTGTGTGTIAGSVAGAPFGSVATALWAGAPDDPATIVAYLFSKPVACSELATPGWDTRITNATSVLEMKAFGTTPGGYQVVTTPTPAPGEASVNYTLSSTSGTPKEDGSTKGTVTLTAVTPNVAAKGSFTLTFGTSTLSGSFDAAYCPGGHEP